MAQFKVSCTLQSLPGIREFVRQELHALKVNEDLMAQLVLVVDEACTNTIKHQHNCDETEGFDLCLFRENKSVVIELTDSGKVFRIDQYNPNDLHNIIQERRQGGLGIFIINKIMDKVEVEEKDGKIVYRFTKNL